MDLITAKYLSSSDSSLTVLTNNGIGGFALAASIGVNGISFTVCATDVNGDGTMDLIYTRYLYNQQFNYTYDGTLTVLTNDGNGNFGSAGSLNTASPPGFVRAADINETARWILLELSEMS